MQIEIIGAGITGLSAGYFLGRRGHKISIFEREQDVGGLAGSFIVNGAHLEKYYHHSFMAHTDLRQMMKELDIKEELDYQRTRMGFYHDRQIYPFTTAGDLLLFRPLNLMNRMRVGLTSLLMLGIRNWKKLEGTSAMGWLRRYSGGEGCRIIWEPLLKSKFGDEYENISAAWLWNRVVDRKKSAGGNDILGYISGGYKRLFDVITEAIEKSGGTVETGSGVDKISILNGQCSGVQIKNTFVEADLILSTIPLPAFVQIAPDLPESYLTGLSAIKYQGSICVVLALTRKLSDFYWINISDPECPFVGIIEHTNFIPAEVYGNQHLVYLTKYAASDSQVFQRSEKSISDEFIQYLKKIFPDFRQSDINQYWVFRDQFSQPVFVKNYSKILPDKKTPIKNLYLLNTSQIYPESRSINSSIRLARQFALEFV